MRNLVVCIKKCIKSAFSDHLEIIDKLCLHHSCFDNEPKNTREIISRTVKFAIKPRLHGRFLGPIFSL